MGSVGYNQHGERYHCSRYDPKQRLRQCVRHYFKQQVSRRRESIVQSAGYSWQRGVTGGLGANNIGLLAGSYGRCTLNLANPDNGGDFYGAYYLFIDDGSGIISWHRAKDGSYQQVNGVKVEVNDPSIAFGSFVIARGISSIELVNGRYQPRLLPRPGMNDIIKL